MSSHWPSSAKEIRKAQEEWNALSEERRKELRAETYKEKPRNPKLVVTKPKKKSNRKVYYSAKEWQSARKQVFDRDGHSCYVCGNLATHIDHLLPKSKYPELALNLDNLKPICYDCNFEKLDIVKEEFLEIFSIEFR